MPKYVLRRFLIFLALPTPPGDDGAADLKYVLGVAEQLSELINDYKVIINKSTVPVGTAEKVAAILAKKLDPSLFDVVSNPEFLREGVAVDDFLKPDRVVVGTSSARARKLMEELYQPFVRQGNPIFFMDERSSEMTKYAANSYLAMRISFMNEMANLCEAAGANIDHVRIGMGSDSRIGKRFLFPGVGYGGSCFPKDVQALALTAKQLNYNFKLVETVMQVNDLQKSILGSKIKNYFNQDLNGKTHYLISSVCISQNGSMIWNYTDKASLTMKNMTFLELENYLKKISDDDLYAYNVYQIEGEGRNLFSKIEGDEDTIMGLPVKKIKEYLKIIK